MIIGNFCATWPFEVKMLLDNIRAFALMPVSLVVALIDLLIKGVAGEGEQR